MIIHKNSQALFSNAAHPKSILLRDGNVFPLSVRGVLIGVSQFMKNAFQTKRIALKPGDKIILYTDGMTESMNTNNEEYGIKRLVAATKKNRRKPCEEMLKTIVSDFSDFTNGVKQADDETLVIIEIR